MKIVISSGHGKYIRGASGYLDEVDEARLVVDEVASVLRSMDVDVTTYHDDVSDDQSENLDRIVDFHNNQGAHDLDVSVHFNAYETTSKPMGTEVLYVTQEALARKVCDAICNASGSINRGPKYRGDLAFLNGTNEPAILIETVFVDSRADADLYHDKFSEICVAIAEGISGEQAGQQPEPGPEPEPEPEPPGPDADSRPTLKKGSQGEWVVKLQRSLGLPADGDFGSITDTQVRAFQAACDLTADGIVGPMTWAEVDALDSRMFTGNNGIDDQMAEAIDRLVVASGLDDYTGWGGDRGVPAPGYISGMAMSFAVALNMLDADKASAQAMAKSLGDPNKDALAWYGDEFAAADMTNGTSRERIRHLFVLLIGLGMRESSGNYSCGMDQSATNTSSDTCEAGLFQSSWNFHNSSMYIEELFHEYWADPNGFLDVFQEGIYPTAANLKCYGSGDGAAYQWLAKFSPAFAAMSTAVGLRVLKDHWGPIKRHEAEVVPEVDELLEKVQELVEAGGSSETT